MLRVDRLLNVELVLSPSPTVLELSVETLDKAAAAVEQDSVLVELVLSPIVLELLEDVATNGPVVNIQ